MKINEIFQKYVNKSYGELLAIAESVLPDVYPHCQRIDKEYNGAFVLANIMLACISADGEVSDVECKFVSDLTGLKPEVTVSLAKNLSMEAAADLTNNFADGLDYDTKGALLVLIAAVLACDRRVTVAENKFLRRIFDY
jgi:uncharacterized tellurite resistance protein B-like protein